MSIESCIEQLKQAHEQTLKVIAGQDLETVAHLDSGWTIKDILQHLALSDWLCRVVVEAHTNNTAVNMPDDFKVNNVNDVMREEYKDYSAGRVLMNYADAHQLLLYAVERMSEEALNREMQTPWRKQYKVDAYIATNIEHEAEHREQIIEALKREAIQQ